MMKERMLHGWTLRRVLYCALGVFVIVYAVLAKEWWGTILGAYFVSMGLFAFGCAGGACATRQRLLTPVSDKGNADYEEVKTITT